MKLTVRWIALALVLALIGSTALAQTFYSKQIANCNEYVTLRAKPSGSAASLAHVLVGEVVMAADYNSEFSYCCYNGKFGYIKRQYLSDSIYPWSEGTFRVANCQQYISLRTMPLTTADVRTTIPLGATLDQVFYHDDSYDPNAFVYVKYNGLCGFVLWRYLTPVWREGWQ